MEIVDGIVESSPKVAKTVKFEQSLESPRKEKSKRQQRSKSGLRSCLSNKDYKNKPLRATNSPSKTKTSNDLMRKNLQRSQKLAKQLESCLKLGDDSRKLDYSRPSSVTSLFTACSTGNHVYTHKFGPSVDQLNLLRTESQTTRGEEKEREVVH